MKIFIRASLILFWGTFGLFPDSRRDLQKVLQGYPFELYAQCGIFQGQSAKVRVYDSKEFTKFLTDFLSPKQMRLFVSRRFLRHFNPAYMRQLIDFAGSSLSKKIQNSQKAFLTKCATSSSIITMEFTPAREKICTDIFLNLDLDIYSAMGYESADIPSEIIAMRKYAPSQKDATDATLRRHFETYYQKQKIEYQKIRTYKTMPRDIKVEFCGQYAELSDQDMEKIQKISKEAWYKYFTKHLSLGVSEAMNDGTRKYATQP